MKHLIVTVTIFLLAGASHGHVRDFSIEIGFQEAFIDRNAAVEDVKVLIRNNAAEDLSVGGLDTLDFEFSKCLPGARESLYCGGQYSRIIGSFKLPKKVLPQGRDFEFQVNLAKLDWRFPRSSFLSVENNRSLERIPKEMVHLNASVKILTGYKTVEKDRAVRKLPVYKVTYSNVIDIVLQ